MVLDIARLIGFGVLVLVLAYPLGLYMAKVFSGEKTWLSPVLAPVERVVYRLAGIDPDQDMPWSVPLSMRQPISFAPVGKGYSVVAAWWARAANAKRLAVNEAGSKSEMTPSPALPRSPG